MGAFCGTLTAWLFISQTGFLKLANNQSKYIPAAMCTEALGAFFLTFMYLTQTEEKTKISNDPAISTLIIAACYSASIWMCGPPDNRHMACLNPAIAFATEITMLLSGDANGLEWFFVYLPFPFVGAILALIFHEFVYKKMQESIEEVEAGDNGILDNHKHTDYDE